MTMRTKNEGASAYGVQERRIVATDLDKAAEEITCLGHCVIESGYPATEIDELGRIFDAVHGKYIATYGEKFLREIDEYHGIRLPLAFNTRFLDLAMNKRVLGLVRKLLQNQFILNQQNGIINPPGEGYNQGSWHRDLPYQHFLSSKPLAINALYCVDDFTAQNGATYVIPASHLQEEFPSESFIEKHAQQIAAPAGSFIVLDGMLFHRGGANQTSSKRRAVNHVYTMGFIRQQIDIRSALMEQAAQPQDLPQEVAHLLGFKYQAPRTVADYLKSRRR